MREHIFFPKPLFPRHSCFPDFIGGYIDFPEHAVNREYQSREVGVDRYYNLHLVLDGKGYLYTDRATYELTQGQGFLYGPGIRQSYHSDKDKPWNIRWVHFYGIDLSQFLDGKGLDEPWLFSLSDIAPFRELFDQLLETGRGYQVDDEYKIAGLLYQLLTRLQATAAQLNVPINQTADKIRSVANYIRSHSNQPFTLEEAAAIANYSPHYFSRRFSEILGISFPQFLLESRLLRAKQLLISTQLSIKQIALDTGFSQSSYFATCFRQAEGMTPQQFRLLHRG